MCFVLFKQIVFKFFQNILNLQENENEDENKDEDYEMEDSNTKKQNDKLLLKEKEKVKIVKNDAYLKKGREEGSVMF